MKDIPDVCESCGGTLVYSEGGGRAVCPYCGRVYRIRDGVSGGDILSKLKERAEVIAANYGLKSQRVASDSFEGDSGDEIRRLLSHSSYNGKVLNSYRAHEPSERVRVPSFLTRVAKRAAYKDRLLGAISFSDGVEVIDKKAFYGCSQLTAVRIEGTYKLGKRAFAKCAALREVTISKHIPEVGKKVFAGCKGLGRVFLPRSMKQYITRMFGLLAKLRMEFIFID